MIALRIILTIVLVAGIAAWLHTAERPAWTTSRVVGSPEPPPPYRAAVAFPKLKFDHPTVLARCPDSNRLYVGQQNGVVYSFENKPDAKAELFFDLKKDLQTLKLNRGADRTHELYGI